MSKKKRKKVNYEKVTKKRFLVFFAMVIILFSIIICKLGKVMLLEKKEYNRQLSILTNATVSGTSSQRGRIYDRNYN